MWEPVGSVASYFVGTAMYISRATPKCCLREISELDDFSEDLRRNWTGHSGQSSGSSIDIGYGELVVPLDPSLLVGVDIYKRRFPSQSTLLVELVGAHFEIVQWAAIFGKEATTEQILRVLCYNGVLKARLRQ